MAEDSRPNAARARSYSGGYMAKGKIAQKAVLRLLQTMPIIKAVQDVTGDPEFQLKEIDFLITLAEGTRSLEVKNDDSLGLTGNFVFELMRINHTATEQHVFKLGWSTYSEADWLAFYAPNDGAVHFIKTVDFRDATREAIEEKRGLIPVFVIPTDEIKSTIVALIPEEFVIKQSSYRRLTIAG